MDIVINDTQKDTLKLLVRSGKSLVSDFNGNTINALANRGLAKISETKKGKFVIATAKAKKVLN